MKHLKSFNESKRYSLEDVTSYIRDMVLDFEDDEYNVEVKSKSIDRFDNMISISIDSHFKMVSASKIIELVERIKAYFNMEKIEYDIQYQWHDSKGVFNQTSLDELDLPSGDVQNIWLEIFIGK